MKKAFLAALLILLVVSISSITQPEERMDLKPHDPIYINGNQDFTPENGVISGSGTEDDPYIIESWEIIGGNFGMGIENIDAFFVIRNCKIHNVTQGDGIVLKGVENGRIEKCTVQKALEGDGIVLLNSHSCEVVNNLVEASEDGIRLSNSHHCTIADNVVENSLRHGIVLFTSDNNVLQGNSTQSNSHWEWLCGIKLYGLSHNLLDGNISTGNRVGIAVRDLNGYGIDAVGDILVRNTCSDNELRGISLFRAKNTTVSSNITSNNGDAGIGVGETEHSILSNNVVESNENGVFLYKSTGSLIVENDIVRNALGIAFWESSGNTFYHNNIIHNETNASGSATSQNQWDNDSEGNYWSDYSGWDGNGNGVSDTPYRIGEGSVDLYPLMRPWKPAVVTMGIKFTGPDEFVTVRNWSEEDVDLTGWQLQSIDLETQEIEHTFPFPEGCILPTDGKLRVHSGPEAAEKKNESCGAPEFDLYRGWLNVEEGATVWDDLEGVVRLVNDQDKVIDEYEYDWWMGG